MNAVKKFSFRMGWYAALIILLLLAAGIGIFLTLQAQRNASAAKLTSQYQTSQVTRGTITVGANGTGTIMTNNIVDLSFSTSGKVAKLDVHPGDQVTSGQSMAGLDNIAELQTAVSNAELNLQGAQKNLTDLTSYPDKNIGQALLDLSTAQSNLASVKNKVVFKNTQRCESDLINDYFIKTLRDSYYLTMWQSALNNSGYGYDYAMKYINSYTDQKYRDTENLTWCQGYTDNEIKASNANLKVDQAKVDQAQAAYEKIKNNKGLDLDAIAMAQAKVKNAELQLSLAKRNLAGATLSSPINGTVISVAGNLGDTIGSGKTTSASGIATTSISEGTESSPTINAGTSAFITVADLTHPLIDLAIDQSDYQNVQEGCDANVTFEAFPGKNYSGTVTLISPTLVKTNGYESVKGVIELKTDSVTFSHVFPLNLPASVEVICQQAKNVMIIPVGSLHNINGNQADVYILNTAGIPEKKQVTTGLTNEIFIEVSSGLSIGDRVITNNVPVS